MLKTKRQKKPPTCNTGEIRLFVVYKNHKNLEAKSNQSECTKSSPVCINCVNMKMEDIVNLSTNLA